MTTELFSPGAFRWVVVGTWFALGAGACDNGPRVVADQPGNFDAGGGPDAAMVLDTPLWSDSSQSIDVSCFAFFQGSMRFAATRDQLSADQLALLSGLRSIDAAPFCAEDGMDCQITIVQGDGQSTTMESSEMNPDCGNPRKLISYETFDPFRRTIACQYAKDLTYATSPEATPVLPDVRCYHGLFTAGGGNIAVALKVDDASVPRYIDLDDCDQPGRVGKFLFAVSDNGGTTTIGASGPVVDPGVDHTCARLPITFPHPGLFGLTVTVTANPMPAGDFYLRFY